MNKFLKKACSLALCVAMTVTVCPKGQIVLSAGKHKLMVYALDKETKQARYVKVLGYTKVESGSGFGISELSVYEYVEGDSKTNETITELPKQEILKSASGKGTYVTGEF